jgi:phosphohistidine phosphatase
MACQLWLLRHAEAEPHGARADAERRLTARGEQQARVAGAALARLGAEFDAVLFSPKARARQTAEIASQEWGPRQRELLREHAPLAEGFQAAHALEVGAELDASGRVLLVGHEPDLSGVVGTLTGGTIDLKKGGLAVVRLDGPEGELALLLRPVDLALIAGVGVPPVGG